MHKALFECIFRKKETIWLTCKPSNHSSFCFYKPFRGRVFKADYSTTDHYVKNTEKWKTLRSSFFEIRKQSEIYRMCRGWDYVEMHPMSLPSCTSVVLRWKAIPLHVGGLRVEVRPFRWADETLPKTHGTEAIWVHALPQSLQPIWPPGVTHEETCVRPNTNKTQRANVSTHWG